MISLIVAVGHHNVIGKNNQLPWHLPADLKHFRNMTSGHAIIMGRKTYESIGKALPNRTNIVVTKQKDFHAQDCAIASSLQDAILQAKAHKEIFIIGGAQIFEESLHLAERIYFTQIHHDFEGDTFFPQLDKTTWKEISRQDNSPDEKNLYAYSFMTYERIN